jgi:retron-type reverse transcriptase
MRGETKPTSTLATQLHRIATRSAKDSKAEYQHLMALYSEANLAACFDALDGKKAVGVDGKTKAMYGQALASNLTDLVHRMKRMSYRPQPVKEVLIPKGNGKHRPLGLSVIEDKIVQSLTGKILDAIYEPLFRESSFGFRPRRSAHQAVRTVINSSFKDRISTVIDVDLENFFGSIDHGKLIALLRLKIKDERFLRYIHRMLKAGVLTAGCAETDTHGNASRLYGQPSAGQHRRPLCVRYLVRGCRDTAVSRQRQISSVLR